VREASRRTLNMRHFDVQILGGGALFNRCVAEMETGEGKTIVAPLAACLQSLSGQTVYIVTVNDYLAHRDAEWMRPIYETLGLTVRDIICDTTGVDRARALKANVIYTTVREMGFEFLREAMSSDPRKPIYAANLNWLLLHPDSTQKQRDAVCLHGRQFAILDEADSVLIDFARAPISMSEPDEETRPPQVYQVADEACKTLKKGEKEDYTLEEAKHKVELKDGGKAKASELAARFSQYKLLAIDWEERLKDALQSNFLMFKDRDYMVQDDTIILIDEITGRKMTGLRLGKELHQALEAKERVTIQPNTKVARSITIQRLFEPYKKLGGMTGTAWQSRREFRRVYKMSVFPLPPNRPLHRIYLPDRIFRTEEERWDATAEHVAQVHATGRPVLIGTRSVRKSELISEKLKAKGIPHEVLNARRHAEEAAIIANAGHKGIVTISTSMAGRGTDIKLGPGVAEMGGLHIVGTERHELRRYDNQLGGRCGRQGDPGSVQYFVSLDDEIFKIFPEKRYKRFLRRYDGRKGHIRDLRIPLAVNKAQRLFEWWFAELRKMLLEKEKYDEKMAEHLYGQ
jgi:preprotein translocase subunit SecA